MRNNSITEPKKEVGEAFTTFEKAERQQVVDSDDDRAAAPTLSTEPQKPSGNFPSWGDCFAMLGIALGAQILVGVLGLAITAILGLNMNSSEVLPELRGNILALIYLFSMVFAVGGTLIYRRCRGGLGPIARFSVRYLSPVILLWGILLLFVANIVVEPLLNLLPESNPDVGRGWGSVAMLILFAPFFEELLCRGIILESLRNRYGTVIALFGSSLFFGVLHMQPLPAVNAFFIGLILGFIYLITQSLWASVLIHAVNNALAYILMICGYADKTLYDLVGNGGVYWAIYLLALFVLLFSAWKIRQTLRMIKDHEKNSSEV